MVDERRKRIKILPDNLVDVIAAGEVVERPASVVKELVENALDAGARKIEVRIENGGKAKIQVSDDGAGMDEDDCLLAIERHATSKISSMDDLRHLRTLGFRGEALPSIASVGRFTLESREGESESGTRLVVDNGRLITVEPVGRARGTTVTLEGLFGKLPARRKFLRTRETETAWCLGEVEAAALANIGVSFTVISDGTALLTMPPTAGLRDRVAALWGAETAGRLLDLEHEVGGVGVRGLISPPSETYSRRSRHRTMVNGRPVRDPMLNRVIASALAGSWPAGRFPALVLALSLEDHLVDLNVHPAKREVRFYRTQPLGDAVRAAVRGLRGPVRVTPYREPSRPAGQPPAAEVKLPFGDPRRGQAPGAAAPEKEHTEAGTGFRVLGQALGTYILAESDDGLEVIDQHAAHERIVYNRLLEGRAGRDVPVQRLGVPLVLTLSPSETRNLMAAADLLRSFGFEIAEFGTDTVRVTAVPADLGETLIKELLGQVASEPQVTAGTPEKVALAVSRWACRQSVTAGRRLSQAEMEALARDLREAESGFSCPHGRPTRVTLDAGELERLFGRR